MRKFITTIIASLSLIITGSVVYAANTSSTYQSPELMRDFNYQDDEDKNLGPVNLCNPNGTICYTAKAYKDHENGRIYLLGFKGNGVDRIYAQKSNDSRWEYMIRVEEFRRVVCYYFSF